MNGSEPIRKRGGTISWATESEKNFLDGLGAFVSESQRCRGDLDKRRLKLLLLYRKSIFERKTWEGIDPGEILLYIDRKIMDEKIFIELYGRIPNG